MEPIRMAFAAGDQLRNWEAECVRWLRGVRGVQLVGWARAEGPGITALGSRWAERRFRRWEREASDDERLQRARNGLHDTGLARMEAITADTADAVLLLGGAALPAAGADAWPAACWAFRHGDGTPAHAVLPALREGALGLLHASFHLIDARSGDALAGCRLPLDTDPALTCSRIAELAMHWPADLVRAWYASGKAPEPYEEALLPRIALPGPLHMLRYHWRRISGAPPMNVSSATGPWNIGVLHQPIEVLLQEDGSRNVRWLPSPSKGKARMEPFGYLDADGELNVLYRKCDCDGDRAAIARVRPKPDNILKRSRTMLDTVQDAGYPFTLAIDGQPHAVVTDLKRQEVLLLPVDADGHGFGEGAVLLGLALHAPTLFAHGSRWWLLGTRDPYPDAQLHAYHAPTPKGPFTEHACSPVKCDVRHSRPAGTPFMHQGKLYRPALDASAPDRLAVRFNRVDALDPDRFAERPVQRLAGFLSTSYGMGVRTVSAMGQITLVDGLLSPVLDGRKANARRSSRRHRIEVEEE